MVSAAHVIAHYGGVARGTLLQQYGFTRKRLAAEVRKGVRDAAASVLGYETLRFDYAQIVHAWPTVEAAVIAAVARLRERA